MLWSFGLAVLIIDIGFRIQTALDAPPSTPKHHHHHKHHHVRLRKDGYRQQLDDFPLHEIDEVNNRTWKPNTLPPVSIIPNYEEKGRTSNNNDVKDINNNQNDKHEFIQEVKRNLLTSLTLSKMIEETVDLVHNQNAASQKNLQLQPSLHISEGQSTPIPHNSKPARNRHAYLEKIAHPVSVKIAEPGSNNFVEVTDLEMKRRLLNKEDDPYVWRERKLAETTEIFLQFSTAADDDDDDDDLDLDDNNGTEITPEID